MAKTPSRRDRLDAVEAKISESKDYAEKVKEKIDDWLAEHDPEEDGDDPEPLEFEWDIHWNFDDQKTEAEELKDEIQNWYDNLPESLQGSSKGEALEECVGQLEEVCDKLDTLVGIEEPEPDSRREETYKQEITRKEGRKKITETVDATRHFVTINSIETAEKWEEALDEFISACEEASSECGSVEFPGMY